MQATSCKTFATWDKLISFYLLHSRDCIQIRIAQSRGVAPPPPLPALPTTPPGSNTAFTFLDMHYDVDLYHSCAACTVPSASLDYMTSTIQCITSEMVQLRTH